MERKRTRKKVTVKKSTAKKTKNEAASVLAKARWSKATKKDRERQAEIARHAGKIKLERKRGKGLPVKG